MLMASMAMRVIRIKIRLKLSTFIALAVAAKMRHVKAVI